MRGEDNRDEDQNLVRGLLKSGRFSRRHVGGTGRADLLSLPSQISSLSAWFSSFFSFSSSYFAREIT